MVTSYTLFDQIKSNLAEAFSSVRVSSGMPVEMAKLVANDHRVSQRGILLALVPPAFVLALGSALVWASKGFRE